MKFATAHEHFINHHTKGRSGEALRRLKKGHGHAEKLFLELIWWPAFGHFNYLYPEYEVSDFMDGFRYLDFAYIRGAFKVCIEIDAFGTHWRDVDRWQFADNLIRQNHLIIDGWLVIRFSYDDIKEKPRRCQQVIQQLIGRWLGEYQSAKVLSPREKEILRFAVRKELNITPGDICTLLGVGRKLAVKLLQDLVSKEMITAEKPRRHLENKRVDHGEVNNARIRSYQLVAKDTAMYL